ncbi:VOC family protein [Halorussus aquaticus]|uniref:VOC family protein n=1 Tax=Halorussus aquaticus TaxID=2953748 RepID=A0ABD5Q0J8_9EURY|nr:VOC family protein [Halorussus aquaticus]
MTDADDERARPVGVNHVALEVGDVDEALDFYESLFEFELRGRGESSAFVDAGDQFLALSETDDPGGPDDHRHFGLVVDDRDAVERRLEATDADRVPSGSLDFRDPWGNRVQVVAYEDVQFTKADHVLRGMGLEGLGKSESALSELAEKGMAPE